MIAVFDTFPWPQFEVGAARGADSGHRSAVSLPKDAIAKIDAVAAAYGFSAKKDLLPNSSP